MSARKKVVAVGGTLREGSSTETALSCVLRYADELGAETRIFAGPQLDISLYRPGDAALSPAASELIEALRAADAIVLGSPGYHGGVSGLVKNALDYTEEMAGDPVPYFSGKPVGCVATGLGWQGCNTTLQSLRSIVHALRGWPTPLGIAINTKDKPFNEKGECTVPELDNQFRLMAEQLVGFR